MVEPSTPGTSGVHLAGAGSAGARITILGGIGVIAALSVDSALVHLAGASPLLALALGAAAGAGPVLAAARVPGATLARVRAALERIAGGDLAPPTRRLRARAAGRLVGPGDRPDPRGAAGLRRVGDGAGECLR